MFFIHIERIVPGSEQCHSLQVSFNFIPCGICNWLLIFVLHVCYLGRFPPPPLYYLWNQKNKNKSSLKERAFSYLLVMMEKLIKWGWGVVCSFSPTPFVNMYISHRKLLTNKINNDLKKEKEKKKRKMKKEPHLKRKKKKEREGIPLMSSCSFLSLSLSLYLSLFFFSLSLSLWNQSNRM